MSKQRPPCKRYREVFVLVEVNGLSAEEAARKLGIKPKSVVDICSRVRTWLRRSPHFDSHVMALRQRRELLRCALALVRKASRIQ